MSKCGLPITYLRTNKPEKSPCPLGLIVEVYDAEDELSYTCSQKVIPSNDHLCSLLWARNENGDYDSIYIHFQSINKFTLNINKERYNNEDNKIC